MFNKFMRTRRPASVSPRVLIVIALLLLGTGAGVVYTRTRAHKGRSTVAAVPKSSTPAQPKVVVGAGDWIGFHNGGPLLGVAPDIAAPPMRVRWKYRAGDDDPAPPAAPTTHPTTRPSFASGTFESSAAIVGDVVYSADTAGAVRAIELSSGKLRWLFQAEDGFDVTPLVINGRVFVGSLGGLFYALAADTGKQLWKFDGGSEIHCPANYLGSNREHIVFGNDGADVYCLEAATGKVVWNKKSGAQIYGTPAVSNGSVLVSGCDAQLRAFDGVTGQEGFVIDLSNPCAGSTAVVGDHLILGTDQGRVLCISAKTEKTLWTFDKVEDQAWVYSSPAVSENIVVCGARDRRIYALDATTGQKIWTYTTRGDVDSSPVISGGRVYVGSKDKKLYVLDLKTGSLLWVFTAGRGIVGSPAIAGGVVVIGDTGGNLFCLE